MNRMEEYQAMLAELETQAAGLDTTLDRAYARRRTYRKKRHLRQAAGVAAVFVIFVLLVNFYAPVAYACSQVPLLRELAAAVTFSKSLSDAVENAYAQPMDLSQTDNAITAEIAYLIVDQKQVNVFYRLDSKKYEELFADPEVLDVDDTRPASSNYFSDRFDYENGELRCLTIDFANSNVPDCLKVKLNVYSNTITDPLLAPSHVNSDYPDYAPVTTPDYLAVFEFLLEFDPEFTATGKVFPVNQTVMLDGQSITISDIEVYPSHMRVNIKEGMDNTAWLKYLDFYIEADNGMKFDPVSSGIIATGTDASPSMVSYRADSTYFYDANHLKLVITGAQWLRKDPERTYINLSTGETGPLPEGTSLESARKVADGWVVRFRIAFGENDSIMNPFGSQYYDADGNEYANNYCFSELGEVDAAGKISYHYIELPLDHYPYDEVWLCPLYSHTWKAENGIVITVQ